MKQVVKQMGRDGEFKVFDCQVINGQKTMTLNVFFANKKYKTLKGAKRAIVKLVQYQEARGW